MKVIKLGHISVPLDNLFNEEFNIDGNTYISNSSSEWINSISDKNGNIVLGIDKKGEVHINIEDANLKKKFMHYFIQTIIEKIKY